MENEKEMKERMKQDRLYQIRQKIFSLEMDIVAFNVIGDNIKAEEAEGYLELAKKAYEAIEAIKLQVI